MPEYLLDRIGGEPALEGKRCCALLCASPCISSFYPLMQLLSKNSLTTHALTMVNSASFYVFVISPAAVDVFYSKVVADEKLVGFFKGVNIETLKDHQRKFLRMAFTTIPKSINVEEFMYDKHKRLFLEGLSEVHFDLVAGHFVATLEQLNVPADLIKEATDIVVPLRPIFEQGAAKAKKSIEEEKKEED